MTDSARPGTEVAPPGESGVPDWKTFARSGEWRRAQAAATLTGADPDVLAALSALSALQNDVRARKYPAARRGLNAYAGALGELDARAQGEAALLRSLAAPEVLAPAVDALDHASGEADPGELQARLAPAHAHALTRAEALNALGVLHALRGEGDAARARGRIVAAAHTDHSAFTLEYEAEISSDQALRRVQLTVTTEDYERTIDLTCDAEGAWLLDDPSDIRSRVGGEGVMDVDITLSVFFASVIIRRLGLHRQQDSAEQRVLSVDSMTLEVTEDSITMSSDGDQVHGITATASTSATVDSDGMIIDIPGLSRRV